MLDPDAAVQLRQLDASVTRTFDARRASEIANDPEVFKAIMPYGVTEPADLLAKVQNPRNYLFDAEGGCILFVADTEPGAFEVHTQFLEGFRGQHAIDCSRNAYRWMFAHTDAMTILTRIPAVNRPARMAARAVGFEPRFTRKSVWPIAENEKCDLTFYELSYQDYLASDREYLVSQGEAFHAALSHEFLRHGVPEKHHDDEACHDRAVGAALEMVYGGQVEKGVILYNRWARWAGYGEISMVSRSPLVVDIGDAVMLIENRSFKVITCRSAQP